MKVECPSCGQRFEMLGRQTSCPNCGQLVEAAFQPPLPPRQQPRKSGEGYEELEMVSGPAPYANQYQAPEPPPRDTPAWVPATLLILGAFIGLFLLMYWGSKKLASYAPTPPAPAPVAPPPAPPPPPTSQGSQLFSFNNPPPAAPTPAPAPPPPPPPAPPAPATEPASKPTFNVVPVAPPKEETVTDEAINAALVKGVNFLVARFTNRPPEQKSQQNEPGTHALVTLALLHAGQAINDERLNIHSAFMKGMLEELKAYPVPQGVSTYTRSLRAQALALYNRPEDRAALTTEVRWLIANHVKGGYGYYEIPKGATQPEQAPWDNSNSQYGALGIWAADEAGASAPPSYWIDVQSHWERTQSKNGAWDYGSAGGPDGTLSMTAAGVNMLFVSNEILSALRPETQIARPPFSPALQAGLDWMAKGENAINTSSAGNFKYYALYGMERAGLACGFKMFGKHDWYRELAEQTLKEQGQDGSWNSYGPDVDTAFAILFLARGRHPLMMNKLHFVGAWANRPRDVAHLAKFTGRETERPLNWQVVDLAGEWGDWMDSPILYLASHEAPIMDETDFAKIRSFVMAGGLLFTQADGGNKEFNQFAELLAMKLFNQELKDVPPNHFVYNALFHPAEKFPLKCVSNGTRLLMVHCPDDIAKRWQSQSPKTDRTAFELGGNLFIYATGMELPRNRLDSLFVPETAGPARVTVPIARLQHGGDWDPEPWAWERESRLFRRETSIALQPTPTDITKLTTDIAPFAHLTSTAALSLSDAQLAALRQYVQSGGVLLIDACGGSEPMRQAVRDTVKKLFPDKTPTEMPTDHPLLAGKGPGLTQIAKPLVRPYVFKVIGAKFPKLQIVEWGKGAVLISELDLTCGLLGNKMMGITGYDPNYAHAFVRNAILWTLNGRGPITAWASTTQPTAPQN
jgi:hypothetical protein